MTDTEVGKHWYLYILRCADNSLYTGITTDITRRLREHHNADGAGRGAKYLRARLPLTLVFHCGMTNRSEASTLEYVIKKLSKADKEALVNGSLCVAEVLSRKLLK